MTDRFLRRKPLRFRLWTLLAVFGLLSVLTAMRSSAASVVNMLWLNDEMIGVTTSDEGEDSDAVCWNGNDAGTWITGSVTGQHGFFSILTRTTTLTLRNLLDREAELSFDLKVNALGGSISLDGEPLSLGVNETEKISRLLPPGGELRITLVSGRGTTAAYSTGVQLTSFRLMAEDSVRIQLGLPEAGQYKVQPDGGKAVTITKALTPAVRAGTGLAMMPLPPEGFRLLRWVEDTGDGLRTLSYRERPVLFFYRDTGVIYPEYISGDLPVFRVGEEHYRDLNEACAAAGDGGIVVLVSSGTIEPGSYTVPSGVTLLIPFSKDDLVSVEEPYVSRAAARPNGTFREYQRLTVPNGAIIRVESGAVLNVNGICSTASTSIGASLYAHGRLHMDAGSSIELEDGAVMSVYGFVTGDGQITAKSGARVYESLQLADYQGGSNTYSLLGNEQRVMLFSQYFVQNIECRLLLCDGSYEGAYACVPLAGQDMPYTMDYFGGDGLFDVEGGSLCRSYDPAADRIVIELFHGTLTMSNARLMGIDTKDYVMPLVNNQEFRLHAGTTCRIMYDMELLPGARIIVDEGAGLELLPDASFYVIDSEEWVGKSYVWNSSTSETAPRDCRSTIYSPDREVPFHDLPLEDALVDVNGTLTLRGGLYTTEHGARLISSRGTGSVCFTGETALRESPALYAIRYRPNEENAFCQIPAALPLLCCPGAGAEGRDIYVQVSHPLGDSALYSPGDDGVWTLRETAHVHHYTREITAPTCTEAGYTVFTCTGCGYAYTGDETEPIGHDWGEWVTVVPATEYAAGLERRVCSHDESHVETRSIPIILHVHVLEHRDGIAPTCAQEGQKEYWYCRGCGRLFADGEGTLPLDAPEAIPCIPHDWNAGEILTAAGCETEGLIRYTCRRDETHVREEVLPPLGHDWDDGTAAEPASCETPGLIVYTCRRDPTHQRSVAIPATGHRWDAGEVTAEPTCEEDGLRIIRCLNDASHTVTQVLPALGHDWDEGVVTKEPTCTRDGAIRRTCQRDPAHTLEEAVPALGHAPVRIAGLPAACLEKGHAAYYRCERCGRFFQDAGGTTELTWEEIEIAPLGHSWNSWQTVIPAGCLTEGSRQRVCRRDESHVETAVIPARGHTAAPAVRENEIPAGCEEPGSYEDVVYCSVCHAELSRRTRVLSVLNHKWGEWTTVTAPTCTEAGSELRICERDGTHQETRTVAALKHDPAGAVRENAVEAACETDGGYDEVVYCSRCGEKLSTAHHILPSAGHRWGEWEERTAPTEDADGEAVRSCSLCGKTESRSIPRLDHVHTLNPVHAESPSCTAAGHREYWTCTGCGALYADADGTEEVNAEDLSVPALGHDPGAAVKENVVKAACETTGSYDEVISCRRCGAELSRSRTVTDALGHQWSRWILDPQPTETAPGQACRVCRRDSTHVETAIANLVVIRSAVGGTAEASASCSSPGKAIALKPEPLEGYSFVRWKVLAGGVKIRENRFIMPAVPVILEPVWAPLSYTLTILGGEAPSAAAVEYNSPLPPEAPHWEDHTFCGWYMDAGYTEPCSLSAMPAGDLTLYALYTENAYAILSPRLLGGADHHGRPALEAEVRLPAGTEAAVQVVAAVYDPAGSLLCLTRAELRRSDPDGACGVYAVLPARTEMALVRVFLTAAGDWTPLAESKDLIPSSGG